MKQISDRQIGTVRRRLLTALLATTVLAGGAIGTSSSPVFAAEASSAPNAMIARTGPGPDFGDLVARVKPAVVNIAVTEKAQQADAQQAPDFQPGSPFGDQSPGSGENGGMVTRHALGSGFIVDPAGYIVTNNHVIDGASKVTVTLADGNIYQAVVKGRDPKTDIALLKITATKPLPYVSFGDSNAARDGNWVIAVGNPYGLGGTVTAGIVSAHGRSLNDGGYDDYLQIDAPINPGNSGGPLFDQSGHVVGVDTAIYSPTGSSVGIGFAIPSDLVTKIVSQLRDHGSVQRGWLGIEMQPISPTLATAMGRPNNDGVLIDQVQPGSPAALADLRQGDVITAFEGKVVKHPSDLALAVADIPQGSAATLTLSRDGTDRQVTVHIAAPPKETIASAATTEPKNPVGLALEPLSNDARAQLGLAADAKGVIVTSVEPNSRAAESGVQPGDLIVKIGGDQVAKPAQAASLIRAAEHSKKPAVALLVMRDGAAYYLALPLTT